MCSGEGLGRDEVLDLLSRLVEKSLVVVEAGKEGAPRFRMLEPVRQYGHERLEESAEARATRYRHASFFLNWRRWQIRSWRDRISRGGWIALMKSTTT